MDHAITGARTETVLYGALELSKNSWLLALQLPDRAQPSLYPIRGGDTEGLMAKLMTARDRWTKMSGKAPSIVLCYEAGYDAFWLARFLKARGIECLVVDAASMQVNRRARRAKTDRIDVGMLLRALIKWGQGDRHVWSVARTPPVSTRRISGARTASATAWFVNGRLTSIASRACCSLKVFAAST
jgi:transposase